MTNTQNLGKKTLKSKTEFFFNFKIPSFSEIPVTKAYLS